MAFIAKNPLCAPEVSDTPPSPIAGTRGLFPKSDGWYDIDDEGNENRIATCEDVDVIDNKVDKVDGKGLSTEDYTTAEKQKLAGLENYDDTALQSAIQNKVDKVNGKGLSTEDYTTADKTKLNGIAENAQVNVLEGVQIDGTDLTVTNKKVNIDWSSKQDSTDARLKTDASTITGAINELYDEVNKQKIGISTWRDVQQFIRDGKAVNYFNDGDQFVVEKVSHYSAGSSYLDNVYVDIYKFVEAFGETKEDTYTFTYGNTSPAQSSPAGSF